MPYNYQNQYQSYFQQFPQYQQQMQQSPQPAPPPMAQQTGGIIWVGSAQEADAYLMAPNSAVTLWDRNVPAVYLKTTDASGKPSMTIYDLVERTPRPVTPPQPQNGPTREEFDELAARVAELTAKKVKPVKKEEVEA